MDTRTSQSDSERSFVPGLGRPALTPLYDLVHRLAGVSRLHDEMLRTAAVQPGQRVLDVGCGTGNLLLALGRGRPDVELVGLDPDGRALARARRKATRAGIEVDFRRGFAEELPLPDASVDRVFSSLMLHHLEVAAKRELLAEVRRVLRPDGVLVLADADGEDALHQHGPFRRRMAVSQRLLDNAGIPARIAAAGFTPAPAVPLRLRLGRVVIVHATPGRA